MWNNNKVQYTQDFIIMYFYIYLYILAIYKLYVYYLYNLLPVITYRLLCDRKYIERELLKGRNYEITSDSTYPAWDR